MTARVLRLSALVFCGLGLVVGLFIGGAQWKPVAVGLPDAGELASWVKQFVLLATTVLGIRTIGLVTRLAFFLPSDGDFLSRDGQHELRIIIKWTSLWSVANIFAGLFTLQYVLGLSFSELFTPSIIGTYLFDLAPSRSFIIAAIFAVAIAFLSTLIRSLNSVAILFGLAAAGIITPLLNSHSASLGDHSLAITSSIAHGLAMSLWVGGLWAIAPDVKNANTEIIKKFSRLASITVAALILSGIAAAYARLDSITDLWSSGYGRLVVIKTLLFALIAYVASKIRSGYIAGVSVIRLVGTELLIMATAIGLGVALHAAPLSRSSLQLPSAAEEILGFVFPTKPTLTSLIFGCSRFALSSLGCIWQGLVG